jgi:hypothetical protein
MAQEMAVARTQLPARRAEQATEKRFRSEAPADQGRLKAREITQADIRRIANVGNISDSQRPSFEQWLRSTLEFCWLVDRHYRADKNKTLRAKKAELTQLYCHVYEAHLLLQKRHLYEHLLGAALQKHVLGKNTLTADRYEQTVQDSATQLQSAVKHIGWLEKLLQHDLKHLDLRPETGDELRARQQAASKPAIKHLTLMIVSYWRAQLHREPKAAAMTDFAAAVFRLAGDRISRETAAERLKDRLRSPRPR